MTHFSHVTPTTGALVLPLERDSVADRNVRLIIRAAGEAGHDLPPLDRFFFEAGQANYDTPIDLGSR